MVLMRFHQFLDLSDYQRILICGDVHDEWDLVKEALAKLHYHPDQDALVFVGDLVDRGPQPMEFLNWIDHPRVLGNHDVVGMKYLHKKIKKDVYKHAFGAAWFFKLKSSEQYRVAGLLEDAPVALTIQTPHGRTIGVVHADCYSNWHRHVDLLCCENSIIRKQAIQKSLWDRNTLKHLIHVQHQNLPFNQADIKQTWVTNIDHVFHGHTPLADVFTCANRTWIDTGACFGGHISILDVDRHLARRKEDALRHV